MFEDQMMSAASNGSKVSVTSGSQGVHNNSAPVVLIVDDNADTRELLRYVMEARGFRVVEVIDGAEAVSVAVKLHPDIILMDTNLPRVDGYSATRQIRQSPVVRDVPVVFLSGHAQPQARAAAEAVGASAYLVKPVGLEELERVVDHQLILSGIARSPMSPQRLVSASWRIEQDEKL